MFVYNTNREKYWDDSMRAVDGWTNQRERERSQVSEPLVSHALRDDSSTVRARPGRAINRNQWMTAVVACGRPLPLEPVTLGHTAHTVLSR